MAMRNQTNFTAKINDVDVYNIKSKIDYKLDNVEDRLECIEEVLDYGDEFYNEYFDEYCNVSLTSDDNLLSDSNVVRSLESMANYILAKDPEYNNTESEYVVNEKKLLDRTSKEDEYGGTSASLVDGLEVVSGYVEVKDNSNHKKLKKQMITPKDLKRDDELGSVLRDYNSFLELISKYTKKNNGADGERVKHLEGKKADLYVYTKHHSEVKDDMIICKDSMTKTHGYNLKNFSESTQPDYTRIDLTNPLHLSGGWVEYESSRYKVKSRGLLSFKATNDYQDDFNCVIIDVEILVRECGFDEFHLDVLELYQMGLNDADISKELDTYKVKVGRALDKIAQVVAKRAKDKYGDREHI